METNLLGYAIGALDTNDQQAMEAHLAGHPNDRAKLSQIESALSPLEFDRDTIELPPELALRTIIRLSNYIMDHQAQLPSSADSSETDDLQTFVLESLPLSINAPRPRSMSATTELEVAVVYRRNIIAAIGLAVAFLAVLFPALLSLRHTRDLAACKNNLRDYSTALTSYANLNDNRFPQVQADEPAGKLAMILQEAGVLATDTTLTCPGMTLEPVRAKSDLSLAVSMQSDYAYSLGYRDGEGNLRGLERAADNLALSPLLADAPLRKDGVAVPCNHRRLQQVLFADGHVLTCTNSDVGYNGDNIFYNWNRQPHAGIDRWDAVLGRPEDRP